MLRGSMGSHTTSSQGVSDRLLVLDWRRTLDPL
jgi:hypothetical protein